MYVAAALMVLLLLRGLTWQWINQESTHQRLTPRGEHVLNAVSFAPPLFPAAALLWIALARRLRVRVAVVLGLMTVLGLAGTFVIQFVMVPFFDGHYLASVPSPDGRFVAHVRTDGFLGCRASVYVSAPRALWGELADRQQVDCGSEGAAWQPDGGVIVTGGPAKPTPLFFGPH